jgi:hypothetical protein
LIKKFENRESVTKLAKGYGIGIQTVHGIKNKKIKLMKEGTGNNIVSPSQTSKQYKFIRIFRISEICTGRKLETGSNIRCNESGFYWKGSPVRTLPSKREKCAPGHKSSKEYLPVMLCKCIQRSQTETCSVWKIKKRINQGCQSNLNSSSLLNPEGSMDG